MLFPTLSFAAFFALVLPVSWLLMPQRVRWRLFMVAASWFFYGAADWRFVPLLAGSTVVNHYFARRIFRAQGQARKTWTIAAVTTNLVVLAWFKYIGFLSLTTQSTLRFVGIHAKVPLPEVLLPIGISFFTFQALSYVIDTSRGKVHPVSLLEFAVYLSFFPHLIAGPIVRATEFLPQIKEKISPRNVDVGRAFWLISLGLFKKVVISSYLGTYAADPLFGFPRQHAGFEALFGVYAYAIQIYMDFSGYTDIAIGLALLLGIRFPQNFNCPYAAATLQDFWRRWHMTLSRWLRDYLYIPLGGSRRGRVRTYVNVMITMLLGGLWHGAAWTFVAWGALHGIYLVGERWLGRKDVGKGPAPAAAAVDPPTGPPISASSTTARPARPVTLARAGRQATAPVASSDVAPAPDLVVNAAVAPEAPRAAAAVAAKAPPTTAGAAAPDDEPATRPAPPGGRVGRTARWFLETSDPHSRRGPVSWRSEAGSSVGYPSEAGAAPTPANGTPRARPAPEVPSGTRPPEGARRRTNGIEEAAPGAGTGGERARTVRATGSGPVERALGDIDPRFPVSGARLTAPDATGGLQGRPGPPGGLQGRPGPPGGLQGRPGATGDAGGSTGTARLWLGRLVTFHLVCLAWIFFRATSFHNAVEVLGRIATFSGRHARFNWKVAGVVIASLAVQVGPRGVGARMQVLFARSPFWLQAVYVAAMLTVIDLLGPAGVAPFIYFRF